MEKVKIRKCESIMDGKAYAVELADGRKATAWNDKVDCNALNLAYVNMDEIEVELKPYKSKAGKEGLNIVAINHERATKEIRAITFETTPSELVAYDAKQGNASANGQYQKSAIEEANDKGEVYGQYQKPMETKELIANLEDRRMMPKPEEFGEADITSINAKSSVKIKKNSKGIGWEIKVVAGEIDLIQALGEAAIRVHDGMNAVFPVKDEEE